MHESPTVQPLPSKSHWVPSGCGECWHWPVTVSQASAVQGLPSSQSGVPVQHPGTLVPGEQVPVPSHASPVVHALPSWHVVPSGAGTTPQECVAGPVELHAGSRHAPGGDGQLTGSPGTHAAPAHWSSAVHPSPSASQGDPSAAAMWTQAPVRTLQASLVHASPSSQSAASWQQPVTAVPETQEPSPSQWSKAVQGSPSSHEPGIGAKVQPTPGAQASLVQGFPSEQTTGVPTHEPATHPSMAVQGSASSQGAPLGFGTVPQTPLAGEQTASRHGSPGGGHLTTLPGSVTQAPPSHTSVPLHGSPSSTAAQSAVLAHAQDGVPAQPPAAQ